MNNSRAANTDENKQYLEERVQEIGGKRGLEGLTTEWEDPPNKATGTFNLRVYNPGHTDPVVMPFSAYDLRWKTYHPEKGEDVEEFSKNEKKFKAGSYKRKKQWDLRIRRALSGFGQSNNPVGFRS